MRVIVRVRVRVSQNDLNPCVAQDTRLAMSKGLTGVPKAPEHKAKIAASQRRRHAAVRVLSAVEAFHRGNQLGSSSEPGVAASIALSVENPLKFRDSRRHVPYFITSYKGSYKL